MLSYGLITYLWTLVLFVFRNALDRRLVSFSGVLVGVGDMGLMAYHG